ncbi:transposase [Kitasatospora sp. NPDC085464]|uniref:transposase n=1 Tax=Kitasatospora sp. NPDC085464 TaxID=3364063 RepID=UPI0037C82BA4
MDLKDGQWEFVESMVLEWRRTHAEGRKPMTGLRDAVNAILCVARADIAWRHLPHDFPPRTTIYGDFRVWERDLWVSWDDGAGALWNLWEVPDGRTAGRQDGRTERAGRTGRAVDRGIAARSRSGGLVADRRVWRHCEWPRRAPARRDPSRRLDSG